MGHAMHNVRRDEKRRSAEEEGGEGGGREEDPGGGGEGGGREEKQGREGEKHRGKENGECLPTGRVRLRGALLQTYILSILIRSIMEVHANITVSSVGLLSLSLLIAFGFMAHLPYGFSAN